MAATTATATTTTKECDYLEQDPLIRGQRYACISFVSPEDVLASKDAFVFGKFVASVAGDVAGMLENVKAKYAADAEVQEMVRLVRERHGYLWSESEMQAEFTSFKSAAETADLEAEFHRTNGFRTSVRGFKIRGVYDSVEDATARAHAVKKFDNNFHVYIAEVGCWCPWSPCPDDIKDGEYAETQLNTLMKSYNENQTSKTEVYEQRKRDMIKRMDDERETWLERRKEELATAADAPKEEEEEVTAADVTKDAPKEEDDGVMV